MTKMIIGRGCCDKIKLTRSDVEVAKERLEKEFAFVGIQV